MSDALSVFPSVGGGFALVFIVGLAVGIGVLFAVFMGSAAVVVERLARTSRRFSIRLVWPPWPRVWPLSSDPNSPGQVTLH